MTEIVPVYPNLSTGYFHDGKQSREITKAPFGQFFSRNNLYLQVFPLVSNPDSTFNTPNAVADPAGLALVASIYSSDGATLLATGPTFTADTLAGTLTGNLDCNTAAMASYVTALTGQVLIEFRFTGSNGSRTVRCQSEILKQLNYSGSPTVIADETYPTTDEMNARALLRDNGAGVGFILTSADGSKRVLVYVDNDGTFHTDAL